MMFNLFILGVLVLWGAMGIVWCIQKIVQFMMWLDGRGK